MMHEELIQSQETLSQQLEENIAVLLYFSSPSCNVCQVLRPKVMQALKEHYPKIKALHVDLSVTPDIAAQYNVLAAPTVILFLEGREFIRKYRTISVDGLMQEIERPYNMLVEA